MGSGKVGVYGTSNNLYGVFGNAGTAPGAAGVFGYTSNANGVAFGASVAGAATTAGYFNGDVTVNGSFTVNPMSSKHGAVHHRGDSTLRLMCSLEAPESWAEDFGEGTLQNGKAEIALDKDFAAVVDTSHLFVYVTGHDENSNGLVVTNRHAGGFTVKERNTGKGNGTFHHRVVARPNGSPARRLETYNPPKVTLPTRDILPQATCTGSTTGLKK